MGAERDRIYSVVVERRTPNPFYGGGDIVYGATLPPNNGTEPDEIVTGQHVQLGYYRDKVIAARGIVSAARAFGWPTPRTHYECFLVWVEAYPAA